MRFLQGASFEALMATVTRSNIRLQCRVTPQDQHSTGGVYGTSRRLDAEALTTQHRDRERRIRLKVVASQLTAS